MENPYQSANLDYAEDFHGAWRDGVYVVVSNTGVLPGRCVGCNEPADRFVHWQINYDGSTIHELSTLQQMKQVWLPGAIGLSAWIAAGWIILPMKFWRSYPATTGVVGFVSLLSLIGLIGYALMRESRHRRLRFGLCQKHHLIYRSAWSFTLLGLIGILLNVASADFQDYPLVANVGMFPMAVAAGGIFLIGMVFRGIQVYAFHPILAKEDEHKRRWIKGFSMRFMQSLPEWQAKGQS